MRHADVILCFCLCQGDASVVVLIVLMFAVCALCTFLCPPTLKKLEGHIAFGLSVCLCVCVWGGGGCVC